MMGRTVCCLVLMIGIVGCASKDAGVAFGEQGKKYLPMLRAEATNKTTKNVDRILDFSENLREKSAIRTDEYNAIQKIGGYIKAGKWEEALALIDSCEKMTARGS